MKELHLTEGRSTGFPKIRRALRKNGSPAPRFETDQDREYFMATLKIHPKARVKKDESWDQAAAPVTPQVKKVLEYCSQPRTKQEILAALGLAPVYLNYKRHIYSLLQNGLQELTIPDKPNSRLQKYRITHKGVAYLKKQSTKRDRGNGRRK